MHSDDRRLGTWYVPVVVTVTSRALRAVQTALGYLDFCQQNGVIRCAWNAQYVSALICLSCTNSRKAALRQWDQNNSLAFCKKLLANRRRAILTPEIDRSRIRAV